VAATTVVVRGPNWLGDTVMALPALRALRAGLPGARITVVGRWASVLRGQGVADALIEYPRERRRRRALHRTLAGDRADLALILPGSFEAALAAWRWCARRRVGFPGDLRRPLLTDAPARPDPREHQVDEYRRLVEVLDIDAPADEPRLAVLPDPAAAAEVDSLLREAGIGAGTRPVGLHLGVAGGPAKRWPAESFGALADRLHAARLTPLLLGAPEDAPRARRVLAAARPEPPSLVGQDRPALLPHVLARLGALVSGDTGVAHLAAALGVPTVTLFGPTDPALSAPRGPAAVVVVGAAPCAPCMLDACPIEHVCMRAISPADVAARVRARTRP
jgi:heptosyltransferase-2